MGRPFIDLAPIPGTEDCWVTRFLTFIEPFVDSVREDMQDAARDHYIARIDGESKPRFVTRLDIILKSDPFEPASLPTLRLIQTWLREVLPAHSLVGEVQAECFGITANAQDMAEVTEGDRTRVNALVLMAIFTILLILVRNLILAAYLLVTVLASYFAALGATALVGSMWLGQ